MSHRRVSARPHREPPRVTGRRKPARVTGRHDPPPARLLVAAAAVLAAGTLGIGLFSDALRQHVLTTSAPTAQVRPGGHRTDGDTPAGRNASGARDGTGGPGLVWPPPAGGPVDAPDATELSIAFGGDLALSGSTARLALAPLGSLLASADLAVCGGPAPTPDPDPIADALSRAGFDTCATATSTAYHLGAAGLSATLDALDGAGISHAGTARDPAGAGSLTLLPVRGAQIALLSYTDTPPAAPDWAVGALDPTTIARDAARARDAGADLVIVALDWAGRGRTEPTPRQRETARELLQSDQVDLIVGTGSGAVQPIERINGRYVVYGAAAVPPAAATAGAGTAGNPQTAGRTAGNTAEDADAAGTETARTDPRDGAVVSALLRRTALGWMIVGLTYSPTWSRDDGAVLPVADALDDPGTPERVRGELTTSWLRTVSALTSLGPADGVRPERAPRHLVTGS